MLFYLTRLVVIAMSTQMWISTIFEKNGQFMCRISFLGRNRPKCYVMNILVVRLVLKTLELLCNELAVTHGHDIYEMRLLSGLLSGLSGLLSGLCQ